MWKRLTAVVHKEHFFRHHLHVPEVHISHDKLVWVTHDQNDALERGDWFRWPVDVRSFERWVRQVRLNEQTALPVTLRCTLEGKTLVLKFLIAVDRRCT